MNQTFTSDIVNLNVGGTRFSTSRQTLCSVQDSFFSSLLSGRIPTCRDETGAIFIDRDPKYFSIILNFLRTKELNLNNVDISYLRHEAEFYGISSLVKRLILCEDLDRSLCGDVLFTGYIPTPILSKISIMKIGNNANGSVNASTSQYQQSQLNDNSSTHFKPGNVLRISNNNQSVIKSSLVSDNTNKPTTSNSSNLILHSRNSSVDFLNSSTNNTKFLPTHSRKSSNETSNLTSMATNQSNNFTNKTHSRNQSLELKQIKTDLGIILTDFTSTTSQFLNNYKDANTIQQQHQQLQVNLIVGHLNWILVAYSHFICCYKLTYNGAGWQLMFQSNFIDDEIERIAINSKHQLSMSPANVAAASSSIHHHNLTSSSSSSSSNTSSSNLANAFNTIHSSPNTSPLNPTSPLSQQQQQQQLMLENSKLCALLAISFKSAIRLWLVVDENTTHLIGNFSLHSNVDSLFFIGSQLVATSSIGKIGVWNSLSQLWQTQDITPIASFDTAGSFLLLGGQNGTLYYIDMQKFPLRMKDNDLLVTELYKDPCGDSITALSVYLTPKTTNTGNWIEIAYGTNTGQVRVIVQHPETVGHGPQLFQSFSVHRGSIIKVMLTEKHLVSVCSESFHVRTWNVTRFRGMISTQPGSTPLASFKIVTIEALDSSSSYSYGNDIGPFGERDNYQVFIQKVVPFCDSLFVRLSSTGKRICQIKSVDYSTITSYCVHECDGPSRLNSRPRRYLFTGHSNGTIQLWDLTTALELKPCDQNYLGGPTASEFVKLLDQCDLASSQNSGYSTPTTATNTNCMISPCMNLGFNVNSKIFNKNLLVNNSNGGSTSTSTSNSNHEKLDEN